MFLAWFGIGGGGGNHLLDYAATDSYWQAKHVTVTEATMSAELVADPSKKPDTSKTAEVRELMAIRALGELKDPAALPLLTPLGDSKDPFVGEYAKRSIAEIQGKPIPLPPASPSTVDAHILPASTGAIAQATFGAQRLGSAQFFTLLNSMGQPAGPQLTTAVITFAEKVGDIRADCITIGVAKDVGPTSGWITFIVRGQFDSQTAITTIPADMKTRMVGDTKLYEIDDNSAVMIPSDNELIALMGPNQGAMPSDALGAALKAGKGDIDTNADLAKVVATVDTTKPLWAAATITDAFRQLPELAGFSTVTIVGDRTDTGVNLQSQGTGADAQKLQDSVKLITGDLGDMGKGLSGPDAPKGLDGITKFLAGLQPMVIDKTVTLGGNWTDSAANCFLIPVLQELPSPDAPTVAPAPADVPPPAPGGGMQPGNGNGL
jgi:hypothetical protein